MERFAMVESPRLSQVSCPLHRVRLTLACGGVAMNSFDDLAPECLGHAGVVYEHVLVSDHFLYMYVSGCGTEGVVLLSCISCRSNWCFPSLRVKTSTLSLRK